MKTNTPETSETPETPETLPSDTSERNKMLALILALTNVNAEMQQQLAHLEVFKEIAMGGPAKYVGYHKPFEYVDPDVRFQYHKNPMYINLKQWHADVVCYAHEQVDASPVVGDDADELFQKIYVRCIVGMIEKTRKSCIDLTSIHVMLVDPSIQSEIIANDEGLSSLWSDLLDLFPRVMYYDTMSYYNATLIHEIDYPDSDSDSNFDSDSDTDGGQWEIA